MKVQISQKNQMIVAAAVAVATLAAKGSIALPVGIPPEVGVIITSWSNFVLQIYAVLAPILLAYGGSQPGILAPPDPDIVVKAQKVADASSVGALQSAKQQAIAAIQAHAGAFLAFLTASCLLMALAPGIAHAQAQVAAGESPTEFNLRSTKAKAAPSPATSAATQPAATPTGTLCTDLINLLPLGCKPANGGTPSPFSGPLQDILNFFASNFDEAAALAVQIPELQDGNGQACWIKASSIGKLVKLHPLPVTFKAAPDFEALRLLGMSVNNLCADPHCTQVFTDLSNGVQQLGLNVPIPSLTTLCTKFPTIVQAAAVAVTPAPAASPAPVVAPTAPPAN